MSWGPSTPYFDSDGDNSAQAVKASGGILTGIEISNPNSVDCYLQLFDALAADVTVGSTTPTLSLLIPAGDGTNDSAMDKALHEGGIQFKNGITYACTTGATNADDPATGLIVNLLYK